MSERTLYPELIVRFNSGDMTEDERERFLILINKNPRLKREVALDKELNKVLADEDLIDLRKKMLKCRTKDPGVNPIKGFLLIAASVLY